MMPAPKFGLPRPRGPLSRWVIGRLGGLDLRPAPSPAPGVGLRDDLQLALYLCYESHFGDLPGVRIDVEWDPELIALRGTLEREMVTSLTALVGDIPTEGVDVTAEIPRLIDADDGPSVSRYMETDGTLDQMRQFVLHRSAYQLKEGDGHTLGVSRLRGRAKQILVEIQAGEYGADAPNRMIHAELFAMTMRELGLDDRRNVYLDALPGSALLISNLISMFGLNRRWRGALVGHLAVFEMTSVTPMGRYSRGLQRLGASDAARRFYDVHILADAEHEVLALEMARELVAAEPDQLGNVLFGARAAIAAEHLFAASLFADWNRSTAHVGVAA